MQPILMDELGMKRALMRIAHEIIEKNESDKDLCIVGIKRRGESLAGVISKNLQSLGAAVKTGTIDITLYRDDLTPICYDPSINKSEIDFDINGKTVILVDDVIYTGRTARAALEAVLALGRPKKIQLAVLVDRGHREVPIRADYVGKNIPTAKNEVIKVSIEPYENINQVQLIKPQEN
ncbi:MAG: bifunctional pyr operon transcriptional regulator/uracil phosphoribosyltransferase PyrR [Acutalibacteraceae bacterium]